MPITKLLLSFPPALAIFLISFLISLLVTIIYKFTTNQKVMKTIQADMKELRDKIKNTKDTSRATALNKQLMEKTMQQIMHSMKSTLITIIPIFFIFGWMNSNLAFAQASPGENFTTSITFEHNVSGEATITADTLQILTEPTQEIEGNHVQWTLNGDEGTHDITFSYEDEVYRRTITLTDEWTYSDPHLEKKRTLFGLINIGDDNPIKTESSISKISVDLKPTYPFGDFRLFGWQPGWLATYFIFTLALTFPIRKLLKVH